MRIYRVSTIRRFHVMRLQLHYGAWNAFEWGPAHIAVPEYRVQSWLGRG